jgi:hypothetical protein
MVLTVYSALSLVTGLCCHHRLADTSAKLNASVGASGPHDFAVRKHAPSSEAPPASTASLPAFVTIAIRPCMGRDGASCKFDLGPPRNKIFLQKGLDTPARSIGKTARRANQSGATPYGCRFLGRRKHFETCFASARQCQWTMEPGLKRFGPFEQPRYHLVSADQQSAAQAGAHAARRPQWHSSERARRKR